MSKPRVIHVNFGAGGLKPVDADITIECPSAYPEWGWEHPKRRDPQRRSPQTILPSACMASEPVSLSDARQSKRHVMNFDDRLAMKKAA